MARKLDGAGGVILGWIVANLLGVAATGPLSFIAYWTSIRGRLGSSLAIGLPIGFAQWIALRRVTPISILWVLTISAGLLLGLAVGPMLAGVFWASLDDESVPALMAAPTTIGLLVGMAQWLLLRGHFAKSLVWPLSSAVGLGLGTWLVLATNLIDQSGIVSIILVVLVYGTATGWVISFSRLPASQRKTESDTG